MKSIRFQICAVLFAFALVGVPTSGTRAADVSFGPATNPVGTVGTGNTTITIATTVPSGTVTAPVAPVGAAPSTLESILTFLAMAAVGTVLSSAIGYFFLTVNAKTTQATITHRQAVIDEAKQAEGMVVHAANVIAANPTLDALPYVDKTVHFINAFDGIFQNIMGRLPTDSERHDAVATAAQIQALAVTPALVGVPTSGTKPFTPKGVAALVQPTAS